MESSERRSPEPLVTPNWGVKCMRIGPKLRCPFCEAEFLYDDIEVSLPMIRTSGEDPYELEGVGEAHQCICGAWFIEGMPDE
jgi:hypothetical protein